MTDFQKEVLTLTNDSPDVTMGAIIHAAERFGMKDEEALYPLTNDPPYNNIIAFFGRRNHAAAVSFVYKSLTSQHAVVRQAAIRAVTRYNSAMAMKALASALANGAEEDLPVLRETLSWFTSTNYAQALGETLSCCSVS